MSGRLVALDRIAGLLLGVLLVAGGLLLVDWRLGVVLDLPQVARIDPTLEVLDRVWWPVAAALLGVLLVLLGLRWLVAHLPRVRGTEARLGVSSASGRVRLDTGSVAKAQAAALASPLVLPEARGRVHEIAGRPLVQVDARCRKDTDVSEVRDRAARLAADVDRAFPSGDLPLRVLVGSPRTRVRDRATPTRAVVDEGSGG